MPNSAKEKGWFGLWAVISFIMVGIPLILCFLRANFLAGA